jgi:hypothetical protein
VKLGHVNSAQQSFIELGLIDQFFAVCEGDLGWLYQLTDRCMDRQRKDQRRDSCLNPQKLS